MLSSFSCQKDDDIAQFLHHRAIEFEELQKAKTYLMIDKEYLLEHHDMRLLGYFTIALKVFEVPDSLSVRARKKLDGFSGKANNKQITSIPCFLIGQLSRNDGVPKKDMPGDILLRTAFQFIRRCVRVVGGRFVMIECKNDPKLISFYKENGFDEIGFDVDDSKEMVQMLYQLF